MRELLISNSALKKGKGQLLSEPSEQKRNSPVESYAEAAYSKEIQYG